MHRQVLVGLQRLAHLRQSAGDERPHLLVRQARRCVEPAKGRNCCGRIPGFFTKFAGGTLQGLFAPFQRSGGELVKVGGNGVPSISDQDDRRRRAIEDWQDDDRPGVPDVLPFERRTARRWDREFNKVELRAPEKNAAGIGVTVGGRIHADDGSAGMRDTMQTPKPSPDRNGTSADIAAAPAIIRFVNVHKRFGQQHVLDGLTVDIPTGLTTVVMGPSGCGKSVMLKHIVGLLRPDAGEVYFDGERIDRLKEREFRRVRLQIGLLFQMAALFDSMNVLQNIEFPLVEHTGLTAPERRERVREALEMVDLAGVEHKLPGQLSGGQRKRVGLARAIVLRPRVVLYDEPTTGLDPIRSDGINELIIKLRRTMNVTSIVVTHDLVSARKVADHVLMLLGGKIAARGTYDQIENHPDPHVQHFVKGHYDKADEDVMPAIPQRNDSPAPEAMP